MDFIKNLHPARAVKGSRDRTCFLRHQWPYRVPFFFSVFSKKIGLQRLHLSVHSSLTPNSGWARPVRYNLLNNSLALRNQFIIIKSIGDAWFVWYWFQNQDTGS